MDNNISHFPFHRSADEEPNVGTLLVYVTNSEEPLTFNSMRFDGMRVEGDNLCAEGGHDGLRIIRFPLANVLFWEFI